MTETNILGIDLAKNTFHVCEMSNGGEILRRVRLTRERLYEWVSTHFQGVIAMEACGGAHYWARRFEAAGYEVRIIAAQFVKAFVKSNKSDTIDAEAICEAASRPRMRFVSTRSAEQQDVQNLHRIRQRLVRNRTAVSNEIRGFLLEYGIVLPKQIWNVRNRLPEIIERQINEQSSLWHRTFTNLYDEFCELDEHLKQCEKELTRIAREHEDCKRLMEIPGVGELTATAIVAAVGNPKGFKNGRNFAAWLGLVPRQNSTGGRIKLGNISKRGDKYIRMLLVQGARSIAIRAAVTRNHKDPAKRKLNKTAHWFFEVAARRGTNRAVVALANKNARRIWVVLSGKSFKQPEELFPTAA